MSEKYTPLNNGDQEPIQSGSIDLPVSEETMTVFNSTLNTFLETLPKRKVEDVGEGWSTVNYEVVFPDGDKFIHIDASTVHHEKFGIVQRVIVRIARGDSELGPDMENDFSLTIEDVAIWNDEPLTIDDEGNVTAGSHEKFYFRDEVAIAVRETELLDDITFDGETASNVVVAPNLQTTLSGEIYQDGVEEMSHTKLQGGLSVGYIADFETEKERRVHERQMAAWRQAREDVGTYLTEGRAQRVIDLLERLSLQ